MPTFIADSMLGKMARWLRIVGFDVAWSPERNTAVLLQNARRENRIVLTRDFNLTKEKDVTVFLIESENLWEQLDQFFLTFGQPDEQAAFTRCVVDNTLLAPVNIEEVRGKVHPYALETHREFSRCPMCGRVYWKGSHYRRMQEKLREILARVEGIDF